MQKEFNARVATFAGAGLVIFVFLVGSGLWFFEGRLLPESDRAPHAQPENPLYEKEFEAGLVRARIEGAGYARLHSFGWVDAQKEIVHIPIARAMNLLLEQKGGKP